MSEEKIKVGVFGGRRGEALANGALANDFELVAVCDADEVRLQSFSRKFPGRKVALYSDYRKFLEHDFDAVMIANYAPEHVWAVKLALAADKHVLSECLAAFTMAEAVELVETVEASGKIYMFAENAAFFTQVIEMRRRFLSGEFGDFRYGECEYMHPINYPEMAALYNGENHWRCWLPGTYYCTHSMGPLMYITETRPVTVNGFVLPYDDNDPLQTRSLRRGDAGGILICRMDNGAMAKVVPWTSLRENGYRCRVCGNRGTMEFTQAHPELRVFFEPFDQPEGTVLDTRYTPVLPKKYAAAAGQGHGGADFFTSYYFAKAIRSGEPPWLNVYRALDMSVIGILGYRSALQGGCEIRVPDFRDKSVREFYRYDNWTPDPAKRTSSMPYPSIRGDIKVRPEAKEIFAKERAEFIKSLEKN